MKKYLKIIILSIFVIFKNHNSFSQNSSGTTRPLSSEEIYLKQNSKVHTRAGDKYLILDISPVIGKFHRVRFYPGDKIKFRLKDENTRFDEIIGSITDSSFTIVNQDASGRADFQEVMLKNIHKIKVSRRIPFVTDASFYFPAAGLVYLGADFFNKGVDGKRFTTEASSFVVAGVLMASGLIFHKMSVSSYKINQRHKLRVIEAY